MQTRPQDAQSVCLLVGQPLQDPRWSRVLVGPSCCSSGTNIFPTSQILTVGRWLVAGLSLANRNPTRKVLRVHFPRRWDELMSPLCFGFVLARCCFVSLADASQVDCPGAGLWCNRWCLDSSCRRRGRKPLQLHPGEIYSRGIRVGARPVCRNPPASSINASVARRDDCQIGSRPLWSPGSCAKLGRNYPLDGRSGLKPGTWWSVCP